MLCSKQENGGARQLVRYRKKLIQLRVSLKNSVHGILLQQGVKIPGTTFTGIYNKSLRALQDYRINGFLSQIDHLNLQITETNFKVSAAAKAGPYAILIKTIPGFGDYSALVVSSEIADITRFNNSHKLCSYAGVVPSVRNSADTIHHGFSITKRGSMTLQWILTEGVPTHIQCMPQTVTLQNFTIVSKRGKDHQKQQLLLHPNCCVSSTGC